MAKLISKGTGPIQQNNQPQQNTGGYPAWLNSYANASTGIGNFLMPKLTRGIEENVNNAKDLITGGPEGMGGRAGAWDRTQMSQYGTTDPGFGDYFRASNPLLGLLPGGKKSTNRAATNEVGVSLLIDYLTGGAGKYVGGALKNVPLLKALTPGAMQKGIGKQMGKVGGSLDEILEQATGKGAQINVDSLLSDLYKYKDKVTSQNAEFAPKAITKVEETINNLLKSTGQKGDEAVRTIKDGLSPSKAKDVKIGLDDEIYGESGNELNKRGPVGKAIKKSKKMVANFIRTELRKVAPGSDKLLDEYTQLAKGKSALDNPYQGYNKGAIIAALLSSPAFMMGGPSAALAVGGASAVGTAAAMPYTNMLFRKLLQSGMRPTAQTLRAIAEYLPSEQ